MPSPAASRRHKHIFFQRSRREPGLQMAAPTLPEKIRADRIYEVDLQLFGRLGFQHTCQLPHEVAEYTAQDGGDSDEEERI
jgi:hypothetical protein